MFSAVLIANRGEIAVRAIRTLKRLGVKSVAVYSDADRNAQHVRDADIAIALGGDKPADSYLRIDKILAAARETGAQAIYPGYGFLSESAEFAEACESAGIAFVGPTPAQIREFGLKHRARELAAEARVPMAPGTGLLHSLDDAGRADYVAGLATICQPDALVAVLAMSVDARLGWGTTAAGLGAAFAGPAWAGTEVAGTEIVARTAGDERHLPALLLTTRRTG